MVCKRASALHSHAQLEHIRGRWDRLARAAEANFSALHESLEAFMFDVRLNFHTSRIFCHRNIPFQWDVQDIKLVSLASNVLWLCKQRNVNFNVWQLSFLYPLRRPDHKTSIRLLCWSIRSHEAAHKSLNRGKDVDWTWNYFRRKKLFAFLVDVVFVREKKSMTVCAIAELKNHWARDDLSRNDDVGSLLFKLRFCCIAEHEKLDTDQLGFFLKSRTQPSASAECLHRPNLFHFHPQSLAGKVLFWAEVDLKAEMHFSRRCVCIEGRVDWTIAVESRGRVENNAKAKFTSHFLIIKQLSSFCWGANKPGQVEMARYLSPLISAHVNNRHASALLFARGNYDSPRSFSSSSDISKRLKL